MTTSDRIVLAVLESFAGPYYSAGTDMQRARVIENAAIEVAGILDAASPDPTPAPSRPDAGSCRLTIEACGLRQSDAARYALTLIGMMIQSPTPHGHSCGGTDGNAAGKWDAP